MYRSYQIEIAIDPNVEHTFSWGGKGFVGSYQRSYRLVYAPVTAPSFDADGWRREIGGSLPQWDVKHLTKHFYVTSSDH